jgi:hypothetical protein
MFYEHRFKNLNGEYYSAVDYRGNRGKRPVFVYVQFVTERIVQKYILAPCPLCEVTLPCGWSRAALPKLTL